MKTLRFLIIGLLAAVAFTVRAQLVITNSGSFSVGYYDLLITNTPSVGNSGHSYTANLTTQTAAQTAAPVIAEAITPDLQDLADSLQDDPVQIFNYVHDHIRFDVYFGSKKGSTVTFMEKSGNDFDQSALLVALLRAAGYTNTGYQMGLVSLPFDASDGSHRDIHHWFSLNFPNTNWSTTYNYLDGLRTYREYPSGSLVNLANNSVALLHLWVTLTNAGTTYYLDPSFKVSEPIAGISLATAMGSTPNLISNALMTAAAGQDFGCPNGNFYVTNLNETALRGVLAGYTTSMIGYLASNFPNASVQQIVGGQYIVPSTNTALIQSPLLAQVNPSGGPLTTNFVNIPTNYMSTLTFNFGGTSYFWYTPALQGCRLALVYGS